MAKCSITGDALFDAETWQKAKRVLHDVKKGWVSDPYNVSLYTFENWDKHGLVIYHCIRGTNSVEGSVHNPIRRNFASLNATQNCWCFNCWFLSSAQLWCWFCPQARKVYLVIMIHGLIMIFFNFDQTSHGEQILYSNHSISVTSVTSDGVSDRKPDRNSVRLYVYITVSLLYILHHVLHHSLIPVA